MIATILRTFFQRLAQRVRPTTEPGLGVSGAQLADSVLDHVHDAVIATDPRFHILSWNRAAETIYGWSADEALGTRLTDLIPVRRFLNGGDLDALLATLARTSFWRGDVIQRHRNGRELVIEASSKLIRDGQGVPLAYVSINRDITARTQAEAALRHSEQDYRILFERANDAILIFDPAGEIVLDANAQACSLYGLPRDALLGSSLRDRSQDTARGDAFLRRLLAHGTYAGFETVQFRADGTPLYLAINASIVDYRGRRAILSINRDISDQKRAAAALQVSEATFRSAFEFATTGVALVALDGRYLRVNPAYTTILGYPAAELLATTYQAITPAEELATSLGYAQQVLQGERSSYQIEKRYIHRQGHLVWVLLSVSLVRDASGNPTYFVAQIQDITERKRAEAALRESEERFRRLSEATFEGIALHDQGIILDANAHFAALFGYDLAEVIGRPALDFAAPVSRDLVAGHIHQVADEPYEAIGRRKDGSTFPGEVRARWIPYQGRVVRVAVVRDLSERKRVEEERLVIERKMQEAQKLESLGVLASGIAHDFNNLLAIILGNASLALLQLTAEPQVRPALEAIAMAARHGAELPRQMLAYAGNGPTVMELVDLNALLHEITPLLTASVGKHIKLHYRLAPALPAIIADPGQLRQVVMNLIINAAEAIGERDGHITVTTAVQPVEGQAPDAAAAPPLGDGTHIGLMVADTGCGMDEPTRARIFEPFFSTKFIGRGLGLAAVAGIMRSHGGSVTVTSAAGQGSTFAVWLPASATALEAAPLSDPTSMRCGNGTILVIDDEVGVREVAAGMLRHYGFLVLSAPDGRAGLALLREHGADIACVLLDLTLPDFRVDALVSAVQGVAPEVPVVLMSGYTAGMAGERLGDRAIAGFVQKPFTGPELYDTLMQAITWIGHAGRADG